MAIMVECPKCKHRNPQLVTRCKKCSKPIPKNQQRIYWVDISCPDRSRKRVRLGISTLTEAISKELQLKENAKHWKLNDTKTSVWRDVRDSFERYLEAENRSPQYRQDSLLYLRRMSEFWSDGIPLEKINRAMVQEFRTTLREKGLSESSCNRYIAAGKAAVRVFDPDIHNPFQIRFYNESEKLVNKTRFLDRDERERLLDSAIQVSTDLYEILIVAMFTGWRKSEILNLKKSDIDWEGGYAQVSQKRQRIVYKPLPNRVLTLLRGVADRKDNDSDYFWINKETGKPYNRDWKAPWQKAKSIANIDPKFRFHDLRHDFAIRAFAVNGSQRTVQDLLGHHQISTTQRYVKVLPEYLKETLNKID